MRVSKYRLPRKLKKRINKLVYSCNSPTTTYSNAEVEELTYDKMRKAWMLMVEGSGQQFRVRYKPGMADWRGFYGSGAVA